MKYWKQTTETKNEIVTEKIRETMKEKIDGWGLGDKQIRDTILGTEMMGIRC